jgi:hypothetical protein
MDNPVSNFIDGRSSPRLMLYSEPLMAIILPLAKTVVVPFLREL